MMAGSGRRSVPDRADGAPGAADAPADEADRGGEVVDLRGSVHPVEATADPVPPASAPPPVASADAEADPAPPTGPGAGGRRPSQLSSRIRRSLYPALAVLLASTVVLLVAAERGVAERRSAEVLDARIDAEVDLRARAESLWTDVLAVVAGGVGQRVSSADAALEALGSVRGTLEAAEESGPTGLDDVRSRQRASVAEFADALDRTDGDPVELGNELEALAQARGSFVAASTDAVRALGAESDAATRRADRWFVLSVVAAVLGLLLAVGSALLAGRRWRSGLDAPLDAIVDGLDRVPTSLPPGAYQELVVAVDATDRAIADAREDADRLRRRAERDAWTRRLSEALELADDESEVHRVVARALTGLDAALPVELLMSDRGSARLRTVASDESRPAPDCPVGTVGACVAIRRGQVSTFEDSRSLNACPFLADRPGGPCSATCVPVTVATRPVGVLHIVGEAEHPPPPDVVEQLVSVSTQVGARLGGLRTLESSRHEASTDGLTGLPNRRALEAQVAELVERGAPFIMVIADLDKFKVLNDTFGHEVGDKALQLFAGVLRDNVRGNDVVARLGGEEFVLVYPGMTVETSIEAIGRLRQALERAVASSSVPPFTCSFGIAHSSVASDGDAVLRVADAGLLQAKELGGDQVVVADPEVMSQVFSDRSTPPPPEDSAG